MPLRCDPLTGADNTGGRCRKVERIRRNKEAAMLRRQVFGACAPAPGFALLPLVPDLLLPDSVPALTSTPSRALFVCVCVALSLSASAFFSCVRTQTPLANL